MKGLIFLGASWQDLKDFAPVARHAAGVELRMVQRGLQPRDWKPMPTIGAGASEIRIRKDGAWRVIYVAKYADVVYVLHCFEKKTAKTSLSDLRLAQQRYREIP